MLRPDQEFTIHSSLRKIRTAAKMTQGDLAKKVNVTRQTIIAIEKGNYVPSVLLAIRIAEVFNIPVEELFRYEKV